MLAITCHLIYVRYQNRTPTFFDLFRPRLIALRSANMMYQWFSVTMCYYGLSFSSTSLAGDAYSNFCLSVFVEIPGYLFCIFVMDCWGRRPILSFCQAISGIFCILAGLLAGHEELGGLQVVFSLAGKFGASACFAIVYVYTAELFPTIIRNTAIGSCSTVARVGGILCLIVIQLNNIWDPLPMLIMGCVAVVAGCLVCNLHFAKATIYLTDLPVIRPYSFRRPSGNRCPRPWRRPSTSARTLTAASARASAQRVSAKCSMRTTTKAILVLIKSFSLFIPTLI